MSLSTVDSPGKKLHDKRLEKQMSVADAARLTHIRPDRIVDLEKDDYSNFPSLAYARGFLLIYARLLEVDVSDAAARLENSNPVDIEEYEYLSGRPAPLTRSFGTGRKVFTALIVIASVLIGGGAIVVHFVNYANRLDDMGQVNQKDQQALHSVPSASPVAQAPVAPAVSATPEPEVRKAEAVVPVPSAPPAVPGENEVVLRPIKKTWVKVQTGSSDSEPIYDDWLYPDAGGLALRGRKFWIELREGGGVEIRKNGQVVPYNSPGIVVQ